MRFTDNNAITAANMVDADILAGTDVSTGEDKKFPVGNLADYMLANRTQPVGGANQSITSAINAANSKADANTSAIGDLETAVDNVDKKVDKKADADGEYDNLIVGTSKQLLSDSYTEDFTPYKFRKSPHTDRLTESIVGASVAWNQLVNTSDTSVTVPNGHKYLSRISGTDALGESTGTAITVTGTDNVHDLTAMFGTTVADALYNMGTDGVKLFRSWYPSTYYPYTEATLEHVSGLEAHDMVGFNTFNIRASVLGESINANTGAIRVSETAWRSDYIRCLAKTDYYASGLTNTMNSMIGFYDADKNFLSRTSGAAAAYRNFTTPQGCEFFIITQYTSGTQTFVDGRDTVCINVSDETMNGQYKPYRKHSYALDASLTLRGLLKYDATKGFYADGDVYKADGTVERRYGIVDLGTLTWALHSSYPSTFYATVSDKKGGNDNILCSHYINGGLFANYASLEEMFVYSSNSTTLSRIAVKNTSYTDATAFKNSLSGTYLVYEKSTVETETAEPFDAIQITDGTEEYITDCLVPVGHKSRYYENLRSKIEGLPTDFSAIICATEPTSKASQNYAVGDYLIYGNTLYKVTRAIATNAALTVGTNISATTIMAEIKALQ